MPSPPAPRRSPEPGKNKTREYVLKGLGLVLVAVVSGMLWWLIQQGGNTTSSSDDTGGTTKPKTKYEFVKHEQVAQPVRDSNCVNASYNDVKKFFEKNPCVQLTRELYVLTVDGRKAYTSVAVVRMRTPAEAQQLLQMTEADNTGNVNDLVREGRVKVPGLKSLSKNNGFANKIDGNDVIIVESDFENGKKEDEIKLDDISQDALAKANEIKN
nr:Proline-rich protein BstNI subfamily 1 [Kibdelosporangium sp. MJ126-NF4]CTQ92006.1 Proline-rich protein BstNI subfamily 1 [Kibdelosporangium sp. MJ126-NF4]